MTTKISSTGIDFPDGDAANPSMGGTDTNTGLFYGTDIVAVTTGGSERLRINSSGNVGIGITPSAWGSSSSNTVIQPKNGVIWDYSGVQFDVGHNYYYDDTDYHFIRAGYACRETFHNNTGDIAFWSGGTGSADGSITWAEKCRVKANGNVEVTDGDLVIGTSGHGIDFSAQTTSSATGATPATSSGDETFNHYEKGTWTPVIHKAGASGSIGSLNQTNGVYIRCGDLLWISFYVYKASGSFGSGSNRWYISGLPFSLTTLATAAYQFIPVGYFGINGGTVNQVNHNSRWQSNSTNGATTITMYGTSATDNWSSGFIEMSGAGVLQLA